MKEWHRTVVLIGLILISIGIILWLNHVYTVNFIDTVKR